MKLRSSSRGCEARPAKGEPARAGSEPGDGLGNEAGEAEARERVGRGVCGLEIYVIPDAQGSVLPEGDDDLSVVMGEEGIVSGGVFDHGTQEEDGPGTWEAHASPREIPVMRRAGDPSPTHGAFAGAGTVG
ncbi:MAG: hypothetical protein MUO25_04735 [Thermoanaerobaculaceae bacterium]|jgi:hypothetical protein|nr:hypothetical protein [Thermoanaerobaculaceae bacterium]